jgi:undecaprenyl-diphosphatase
MQDRLAIAGAKYLFLLIIAAAGIWAVRQPRQRLKRVFLFGLVVLPLAYVGGLIAGRLYDDPRPFVVGHFTPLVAHEPDNGFPSDHLLLCASVAAVVVCFQWKLGLMLWVLTAIVAVCRVYVGVHHAVDVIASMLIVAFVAVVVRLALWKTMDRIIGQTAPAA